MRTFIVVTAFLAVLVIPRVACADDVAKNEHVSPTDDASASAVRRHEVDDAEKKSDEEKGGLDIGVLGGVGFPRPLAIEAVVGLNRFVMFGAEYGRLPKTTIGAVRTELWSAAGGVRLFPFKGAFFVGLRAGYQEIAAAVTLSAVDIGAYSESLTVGTWFVNPRVGFLWRLDPFAIGIDAGLQVPVSASSSRATSTSVAGLTLDARLTDTANALGRAMLPTVDLLRIGLVF